MGLIIGFFLIILSDMWCTYIFDVHDKNPRSTCLENIMKFVYLFDEMLLKWLMKNIFHHHVIMTKSSLLHSHNLRISCYLFIAPFRSWGRVCKRQRSSRLNVIYDTYLWYMPRGWDRHYSGHKKGSNKYRTVLQMIAWRRNTMSNVII